MKNPYLKEGLYGLVKEFVQDRIDNIKRAMADAQESANEEQKSSAGDKYETGRAMAQLEKEKLGGQLAEATKLLKVVESIEKRDTEAVQLGSVVITDKGSYYISISAGKISIEEKDFFAISTASPIGQLLVGRRAGEEVVFNKQHLKILEVL
jgi:transcription elongation GreA/GreB family factor